MTFEQSLTDYDTIVSGVGVRVIHTPSGASGESYDERTVAKNKKQALRRMTESAAYAEWVNRAG